MLRRWLRRGRSAERKVSAWRPNEHVLVEDDHDPRGDPGWGVVEFLLSLGADEFTIRFLNDDTPEDERESDEMWARLASFYLGERRRQRSMWYADETPIASIDVWRLNELSLDALRAVMAELGDGVVMLAVGRAWIEDLCVYRDGQLVLGTITHEHHAWLQVSDEEWHRWVRDTATIDDQN